MLLSNSRKNHHRRYRYGRFLSIWLVSILLLLFLAATDAARNANVNNAEQQQQQQNEPLKKDYSSAVVGLFNNMRTPAALISGSIVPLGIMSAPAIDVCNDSSKLKFMKTFYIILAVASLLSEILAVTYASIAINKLVEVPQPATTGVAELIELNHELAWVGTNIHFLFGMMGFGLIVGMKVYFSFGEKLGNLALGWSVAAFLQALSIVNAGIAMGHGEEGDMHSRFASNFFFLNIRYIQLVARHAQGGIARGGVCALGAIAVAVVTGVQSVRVLYQTFQDEDCDKSRGTRVSISAKDA